tara:strand:- start:723 stop:926 length:204 start_codon:yes stop_codon:yes gene_type:complete
MREKILNALKNKYMGIIAECEANIEVYLENPVGIGEHPDIIAALDSQMTILAEAEDKLNALEIFREK